MQGLLTSRAVLSLKGEDAVSFLQGIVTQDVTGGAPMFTALLTPQGKILFDFFLFPAESGFLIDCDAAALPALLKRLTLYKLRAKVMLAARDDLGVFVGAQPLALTAFADPRLSSLPVRTIAPRKEALSADDAFDSLRLSLGVPEFGRDFAGDEMFLLDVNYDGLRGVSYKKGCFVGQEVTSRMKRKGEIRKRTLIVKGAALTKGAAVMAGESTLGEVLSASGETGLALIRLDRLVSAKAEGRAITVADAPVQIEVPGYLEAE